ncbi:MAG TPA: AraC family transcriptional regulator [Clostridia bacterium]|nr:AraC family transcriptional regulator [Clostridia bacterium]
MGHQTPKRSRVRFQYILTSYLVIALVPLLLGLVVFQHAIDALEDTVYRFHRQLLQEYRQVTDAAFLDAQNTVMRLTWDDQVIDMGRTGPILEDSSVTFVLPEVSRRIEKIVSLENAYLDIFVYAASSNTVATSQFSFVEWDRFYDVFFQAEGFTSESFQAFLRENRTIRFLPLTIRRLTGGRWTQEKVLLHAMDFPISGAPLGKVVALVSLGELTRPMQKLAAQGMDAMMIADAQGNRLASMGDQSENTFRMLEDQVRDISDDAPEILPLDGRRTLALMEPSTVFGMRYVAFVEYENLFGVVLRVGNAMYGLVILSCLLIVCSSTFFARRQSNQFRHLALKADEMEEWLDRQKTALAGVFLDTLLRDEFADEAEMRDFAERIGLTLTTGEVGAIAVRFDVVSHEKDARKRMDLGKLLLKKLLSDSGAQYHTGNLDDHRVAIIVAGFDSAASYVAFVKTLFGAVPEQIDRKLDLAVTAVASDSLAAWMNVHLQFRQCNHELGYAQGPGLRWLQAESPCLDELWYPLNLEERILSAARKGGTAQLTAALNRFYEVNWAQRKLALPTYRQLLASLRGTAYRCLQACDEPGLETEAFRAALDHVGEHGAPALMFGQLRDVLIRLCEGVHGARIRKGAQQAEAIIRFVDTHFADNNLSLSVVANQFHLSEPYLSRIFKEATSVNYSEYLERKRIEQACALLSQAIPIQEAAHSVGYNSVAVFRNAFKRVTGTTPGAFAK